MITISQVPFEAKVDIDGVKFIYRGQAMVKFKSGKTSVYVFKEVENNQNQRVFPVSKTLNFEEKDGEYFMQTDKCVRY